MKPFMDKDFLLKTDTARTLYHQHAARMPIIDYHCHINPAEIAEDRHFPTITQVWLGGDHYKWRVMRANGVPERCVTGDASDEEKFHAWAATVPQLIGNPLYHWTHLELQRYFDIHEPLSAKNADEVYAKCNAMLARSDMSARGLMEKSNVQLICTTDDPVDDLRHHMAIAADAACPSAVLPTFRPDKALRPDKPDFGAYLEKLEKAAGMTIGTVDDLRQALLQRIAFFHSVGCRVADHGLDKIVCRTASEEVLNMILKKGRAGEAISAQESEAFQTALLRTCARAYKERDWAMQLHFGCVRNASSTMFEKLGPDTGYDTINDEGFTAPVLSRLLDLLERDDALPRTILYSLNPTDNAVIATVMGSFQTNAPVPGRLQMGSAWWFNDHKKGMEQQLTDLMSMGVAGTFVGMLTDSRSFLSYTRHEYFRRILCNLLGTMAEEGEYPRDLELLGSIVENISYRNTRNYFGFDKFIK
ncbi:MAG: glucuronate isomerase [Ruminococcaceae bacterium]|nr:glucuronate isomerase [Oscillospiraceae bacterium]